MRQNRLRVQFTAFATSSPEEAPSSSLPRYQALFPLFGLCQQKTQIGPTVTGRLQDIGPAIKVLASIVEHLGSCVTIVDLFPSRILPPVVTPPVAQTSHA